MLINVWADLWESILAGKKQVGGVFFQSTGGGWKTWKLWRLLESFPCNFSCSDNVTGITWSVPSIPEVLWILAVVTLFPHHIQLRGIEELLMSGFSSDVTSTNSPSYFSFRFMIWLWKKSPWAWCAHVPWAFFPLPSSLFNVYVAWCLAEFWLLFLFFFSPRWC